MVVDFDRYLTSVRQFLPSWSQALQVQESGFSLRGALWATSLPPAEVVVDMESQTQSEDRSHSWNIKKEKEAELQDKLCDCALEDILKMRDLLTVHVYYVNKMPYFTFYTLIIYSTPIQKHLLIHARIFKSQANPEQICV